MTFKVGPVLKGLLSALSVFSCAAVNIFRGFVKLKKIQKSEKNSEVGRWVKPELGFGFFLLLYMFKKNGYGGGVWPIGGFLGFFLT